MTFDPSPLLPYGWSDRWAALLAAVGPDVVPGRVVRHDGTALMVVTPDGTVAAPLGPALDPQPAVGDWVALRGATPTAVLARTSLLRRRATSSDHEQPLVANIDAVLIVCGLDRPVKPGRVQRLSALAWDAGAVPTVVLSKADTVDDVEAALDAVRSANSDIAVIAVSAHERLGIEGLRDLVRDRTVTLIGESGAGKSSLVNALLGTDAASTGAVRAGDAKGRHTTTARELHPLEGGGVLVDTPGIRAVGLWVDPEAVDATFVDLDEIADQCRFTDCSHGGEPGCAVAAAVADGTLPVERLDAWRALRSEAAAASARADAQAARRRGRGRDARPGRPRDDDGRRQGRP